MVIQHIEINSLFPPGYARIIQLLIMNIDWSRSIPVHKTEHHKYSHIHSIMTYCLFTQHRPSSQYTKLDDIYIYLHTGNIWRYFLFSSIRRSLLLVMFLEQVETSMKWSIMIRQIVWFISPGPSGQIMS